MEGRGERYQRREWRIWLLQCNDVLCRWALPLGESQGPFRVDAHRRAEIHEVHGNQRARVRVAHNSNSLAWADESRQRGTVDRSLRWYFAHPSADCTMRWSAWHRPRG
jgi:hypothetical protein